MSDLMSLKGKVIIVTGAAQGVGKATAELALQLGARVGLVDMQGEALQEITARYPGQTVAYTGSVSDADFVASSMEHALSHFGKVDGLVNCAGIVRASMIENMTLPTWNEVIDCHLTGSFLWLQAVGAHLVERAKKGEQVSGSIVNISSEAGRRGSIGQINYSSAKAGMLGMTMSAAREWGKYGVRTNSICLGVVETPMTETIRGDRFRDGILSMIPMGRWAQPQEVAQPICFLLSDAASYILGQHIGVNGGYHLAKYEVRAADC